MSRLHLFSDNKIKSEEFTKKNTISLYETYSTQKNKIFH